MTVSKSTAQAASEIIASYTASDQQPLADTSPGTVTSDIINSVASEVSTSFSSIEQTRLLSSLQNALLVTPNALSAFGSNWDVVQGQAVVATGMVTFQKLIQPSIIINFPAGTIVQTTPDKQGNVVQYKTTAAVAINAQTPYNPVDRAWEVTAPITALVAGSVGNVGPGAINQLATPNRNIDVVTNQFATSGGSDLQPNNLYATAILTKTAGSTLGTAGGYQSSILDNFPSVTAVAVAGPGNPAMQREQYGDEIDIYLLGTSFTFYSATLYASGNSADLLSVHPTVSLSTVTGTTTGTNFIVGTDVSLLKDTSVVFGNSVNAFDYVQWLTTNRPGAGQKFTVNGFYDANVPAVQNYLNEPQVRFVTANILAKSATRVGLQVNVNITAASGVNRATLASQVQSAVINGLTVFSLGQNVTQSSIVDIIAATPGVNEVTIPFNELATTGSPLGTVEDEIVVLNNSYIRADQVVIVAN